MTTFIQYNKIAELGEESQAVLKGEQYPCLNKVSSLNANAKNNNLLFEADNLLTLLYMQNQYSDNVDVIYIDPPYNTKNNDFLYQDKYTVKGDRHSAWLSLMERRLILAKNLLKDDGFICVSIDNNEAYHLKLLLDKVFGEDNFVDGIIWVNNKAGRTLAKHISHQYEFIFMYAKNKGRLVIEPEKVAVSEQDKEFKYEDSISRFSLSGTLMNRHPTRFNIYNRPNLAYAIYYNPSTGDAICRDEKNDSRDGFQEPDNELIDNGYVRVLPKYYDTIGYGCFRWSQDKFMREYETNIVFKPDSNGELYPYTKRRISGDTKDVKRQSIIELDGRGAGTSLRHIVGINFPYPKPVELVKHIISMHPNKNALVLDFFAGSGTTGQATLELNHDDGGCRRFILATSNQDSDGQDNGIASNFTSERMRRVITGDWVSPQDNTRTYPDNGFTHYKVETGAVEAMIVSLIENTYNVSLCYQETDLYCGENEKYIIVYAQDPYSVELLDDSIVETVSMLYEQAIAQKKDFIFVNPNGSSIANDLGLEANQEVLAQDFVSVIDNKIRAIL